MSPAQPTAPSAQRLVILDGHGIIYRAYFAVREPLVVQRSGEVVTAVYGFTNTLLRVIDDLRPTHIAVAMDAPGPTFRHENDETYKAHRPPQPADLGPQIDRTREVIEAFAIPIYEAPGWEADDVLATLADQAAMEGVDVWIATLDSDLLQLVRPGVNVFMYRPYQRDTVLYDSPAKVRERYGIDPLQLVDFKGLKGDASDNIPGVPGIGEKTAVKLLTDYGSVEEVYQHLDEIKPPRLQQMLKENREAAFHSKMMATIDHDAPVEIDLPACSIHAYDRDRVLELFRELEFRSFADRLPESDGALHKRLQADRRPPATYDLVRTAAALRSWIERARKAPLVAVDLETSGQDTISARIAGYALAVAPGEAMYVPVEHAADGEPMLSPAEAKSLLQPLLEEPTVPKVLHNAKFDMKVLARHGVTLRGLQEDTMIAAYLLGDSSIGLKALTLEYLGVEMTPITALIGTGKEQRSMVEAPAGDAGPYAAADADMTLRLHAVFADRFQKEPMLEELYRTLELPLIEVLAAMELHGVTFDTKALRVMATELEKEIKTIVRLVYENVGYEFNLASPKQLSQILFGEIGLPKTRRVSHGWSTDARALEQLAGAHPVVELILQYRELAKLKSTYVDTLPGLVNPQTGRIHTDYNQAVAATGRLSSENPNLQNIPVRTELGRQIRRAFVPRPLDPAEGKAKDFLFLGADYSQIELRVLAHLSQDPGLIEAFRRDEDIHAATASGVYGVRPGEVDAEMRRVAKMMNFGIIYGLTDFGLAQRAGMERKVAREFIDAYFARFARVRDWIEEIKESTRKRGYAETLLGRRRYIPEINAENFQVRSAAERVAVNMPVQGTAADVIKRAMLQIHDALRERELRCRMLLQVHDELIFELPKREVEEVAALLEAIMPRAIEMGAPLKIDLKAGPNWGDMAPLEVA